MARHARQPYIAWIDANYGDLVTRLTGCPPTCDPRPQNFVVERGRTGRICAGGKVCHAVRIWRDGWRVIGENAFIDPHSYASQL